MDILERDSRQLAENWSEFDNMPIYRAMLLEQPQPVTIHVTVKVQNT